VASNTTLNPGTAGDVVATKERTHDGDATKVQVVTLAGVTGTEGSYTFADVASGAGAESAALRVTLATESLAALETVSVSDGGGSITVDGTVELGATTLAALESITVVDGGGSLTVDGTVELGSTSLAALESLTTITTVTTVGAVTSLTNALPAGSNNIGDVDVLSIVPGTGATNLGKAEDAAHTSADTGVMALAVRRDADTTLVDTTGDYAPLQVNAAGSLKVAITSGAGSGGTSIADGASFTRDTTSVTLAAAAVETSAPTLTNGDAAALSMTTGGALRVAVASGGIAGVVDDVAVTPATTEGIMIMAMADETSPDSVDEGDGGMLRMTLARALHVNVRDDAGDSCMDGTNNAVRVNIVAGAGSGGTSVTDDAAYTVASGALTPAGGYYNSTRDLVDSGDAGTFAMSARRAQYIVGDTIISTANSTTANLAGAAAFTGTAEDVSDFSVIQVNVFSSHASGTDGLSLQQSSNGTNWDHTDVYTIAATTGRLISLPVQAQYFRLVYTNGATLTTTLRVQVMFKSFAGKSSAQRPGDATSNENDFEMVSGFLHAYNGTTWDRLRSVNTGMLQVAPTFAGTVSSTGVGASGAQTQRVVTATDSTIGTVTAVTTLATLTNITNWGNVVDDAAATPATTRVLMAGYFADDTATDSVDEGDAGMARMTLNRKQISQPYESEANTWVYAAAAGGLVNTTGVTAKAAAGAGLRNYITSIQVINSHQTTGTEVLVRDGAAGTVIHRGWAAPNAGYAATFPVALRGTANTLVEIGEVTTTATAGVLVNLQGYVGA
jgi:hypothetical protein